jgi:hypothetical protein
LAHEPEEYSQLAAVAKGAFVTTAISKLAKIKRVFQSFEQSFIPGLYAISTFKGSIQKFYYSGDRGGPFPVATSGYGLPALWGYCTCGQILNKGQPAPGQVINPGGISQY